MPTPAFLRETIDTLSHATVISGALPNQQIEFIQNLAVSKHDTVTLDAKETGGIKEVRAFAASLLLSPQFGTVRLGIVYHAHMLTPEAQNALLKLLEEPPERVKIILFLDDESAVLPTVLSRCRRYWAISDSDSEEPLFQSSNPLDRFSEIESLAKDDALEKRVNHYLTYAYHTWCNKGRPEDGLDELGRIWYLYEQLHGQVNKRLLLENEVLSSL